VATTDTGCIFGASGGFLSTNVHCCEECEGGFHCHVYVTGCEQLRMYVPLAGLVEKGAKAEDIGRIAAEVLLEALATGGCVDEWLQDQLIVFMALASGRCISATKHPKTRNAQMSHLWLT
jgi:RNA 3'-terminal phosphate cyclase